MPLIVVEVFLGFGVPLVWAVWELVSLKRDRDRRARAAAPKLADGESATPPDP